MQPAERLTLQGLVLVPLYYGVLFLALMALAVVAAGSYGLLWMFLIVLPWFVVAAVLTYLVLLLGRNEPWKGPYFDTAIATAIGLVLGSVVLLIFLLVTGWGGG